MSDTLQAVLALVARQEVVVSDHGYDALAADAIPVQAILAGVRDAIVVEDDPTYAKGPCVLVLQQDRQGQPVHVVWGMPKDAVSPAVIVTAYRPDPTRWTDHVMRRKV
jgi:hypothetical protein